MSLLLGTIIIVLTVYSSDGAGQADEETAEQFIAVSSCSASEDDSGLLVCPAAAEAEVETEAEPFDAQLGIFFTSTLLTLVTGMNTFWSPGQRWREIRAVAENLQSEVFQFRTRTGKYTVTLSEPKKPEQQLIRNIQKSVTCKQLFSQSSLPSPVPTGTGSQLSSRPA